MSKTIQAADLFCGAGGTSTGMLQACEEAGVELRLLAINHDQHAIGSHTLNHPGVRHLCMNLDSVDPRKEVNGRLGILAGSPECQNQGCARGGKPINDQSRATAWHVLRWVDATRPEAFIIENVSGFKRWGPLNSKNRPIKSREGELFEHFIQGLRLLDNTVDYRILNAADHGDATSRERLIILGLRGRNRRIIWPEPTHLEKPFNGYKGWRPAREIIDWSIKGKSIFNRKRPLRPKTMERIVKGLRRFAGEAFIVGLEHSNSLRTFSLNKPMPTVTTADAWGIAEPFLVKLYGTGTTASVDEPLPTVTAGGNHLALCEPFVLGQQSCSAPRGVSKPLPTIATDGAIALVEPFVVKYYGAGIAKPVSLPLDTITTKDRFALVEPEKHGLYFDVRFRMLQPHELSAAMGFPKDYKFTGNREKQVWQIGNAVPVNMAKAITRAQLKAAYGL